MARIKAHECPCRFEANNRETSDLIENIRLVREEIRRRENILRRLQKQIVKGLIKEVNDKGTQ